MSSALTPTALAAQAITTLPTLADARVATQSRVYFKPDEQLVFYGVKTPAVRKLTGELYAQVRTAWCLREAVKCCDLLLKEREHEARIVGILLLARFQKLYDAELPTHFESWFTRNRCDNWALTDAMSCEVIGPWLKQFPDELPHLVRWAESENLWLRRASVVALVPLAKQPAWHAAIFAQAERLLACPEDLMHKAVGWLLREAGQTDEAALRKFLKRQGKRMARTTLRYAIECFPAGERKAWLQSTRQP